MGDGEVLFSVDPSEKFRRNPAAVLPFYALPKGYPEWRTDVSGRCRGDSAVRSCEKRKGCLAGSLFSCGKSSDYLTRNLRPSRRIVVDLMPFSRQMLFTVVPYLRASAPSVSPERIVW